ncbi:TetR/AcrR family transcriptional regulator [Nocardioides sp. NPDC057767]|jgi:AcrR family transcriptional regulator|uniref:TetR family transcriptional regulator n=2 Tax=Nocardioides TaxID=1839 RepID=A0A543ACW4_9ACTN|nr:MULTISPECIES: TetR/AcrR family transcriptional regulator [Nocardioides]EGD41047.1 putative transcriptional regulator, TetR family [Nocardioidaceae bacterium Broad-1]MBC7277359.1 TetR/AcrR family transcriptional regulator [Nocardioides sp.]NYI80918.1 AcrR family transcriptional regulator [Nocardioides panzhihuensis]TQL70417.1 TetR family transcriptional regulator [Nocardioides albertanoniae]
MRQLPASIASKLYGAAELIAERGVAEAKMDEIAAASGIPRATLYYYFTGKDEILAFLLTDMLEAIAGEVAAAVGATGSARVRLEAAVQAQIAVMLDQPAACRALVGDLGRATRLPALAHALQEAFRRPIEQLLAEGAADGSLHVQPHPEEASLAIFGAITVAGLYHAVEDSRPSAEQVAKRVLGVLMQGLGGQKEPRTTDCPASATDAQA